MTAIAECLVCDTALEVDEQPEKGEIIPCRACGQEHEIVRVSAERAEIELAPEVEEDWGE